MPLPPLLTIHTDGASRGNPGPAAFAYVINGAEEDPIEEAGRLGRMTNNQAEYTALVRALEHALELGADHRVLVRSDSELLVKQMSGQYRVKNEDLRGLFEEARALAASFRGGVTFQHVRREQNGRADALGNEALDGLREPTPRASTIAPRRQPAPKSAAPLALRQAAVACLRQAAAAWAATPEKPTPEQVWDQLLAVLTRHGIPSPPGAR
jgi:ribonuclease HI